MGEQADQPGARNAPQALTVRFEINSAPDRKPASIRIGVAPKGYPNPAHGPPETLPDSFRIDPTELSCGELRPNHFKM